MQVDEPDLIQHDVPVYNAQPTGPDVIQPQLKLSNVLLVAYYRQFFDLNTEDFFGKIILAMNPFNNASVVAGQDDDDPTELYGFIWITATLIFLMFVSSTGSNILAHWLHSGKDDARYEYLFDLLTISMSLFYGYTVVVPVALYVITTWVMKFPERLSLTRLLSIYSYANVLWIPITVANFVLVVLISNAKHHKLLNLLQWIIVALSGAVTGLSIMLKVRPILLKNSMAMDADGSTDGGQKARLLVFAVAGAQVVFTVLVKVLFFGIS